MQDPFVELTSQDLERATGGFAGMGFDPMSLISMVTNIAGKFGNKDKGQKVADNKPTDTPTGTPTADAGKTGNPTPPTGGGGSNFSLANLLQGFGPGLGA